MVKYISRLVCKEETINATLSSSPINRTEEIELLDTSRLQDQPQRSTDPSTSASQNAADGGEEANAGGQISTETIILKTRDEINQSKKLLVLINNQIAMLRIRLQEREVKEQNKRDW
jgi:hypothetical protein